MPPKPFSAEWTWFALRQRPDPAARSAVSVLDNYQADPHTPIVMGGVLGAAHLAPRTPTHGRVNPDNPALCRCREYRVGRMGAHLRDDFTVVAWPTGQAPAAAGKPPGPLLFEDYATTRMSANGSPRHAERRQKLDKHARSKPGDPELLASPAPRSHGAAAAGSSGLAKPPSSASSALRTETPPSKGSPTGTSMRSASVRGSG